MGGVSAEARRMRIATQGSGSGDSGDANVEFLNSDVRAMGRVEDGFGFLYVVEVNT